MKINLVKIALFLAVSVFSCQPDPDPTETKIASLNEETITLDEVQARIPENRAFVIAHYRSQYSADFTKSFWSTSFGNMTPEVMIRKIAMHQVIQNKMRLMMARDLGLIPDISYRAFLDQHARENQRRKQAIAEKKVIYGPVEYSETIYYNYILASLNIDLIEKLDQMSNEARNTMFKGYLRKKSDDDAFFGRALMVYVERIPGRANKVLTTAGDQSREVIALVQDMLGKNISMPEIENLVTDLKYQIRWQSVNFDDCYEFWRESNQITGQVKEMISKLPMGASAIIEETPQPSILYMEIKKDLYYDNIDDFVRAMPAKFSDTDLSWLISSLVMQSDVIFYPEIQNKIVIE